MKCSTCGVRIPDERLALVPGTNKCVQHSTTPAYKGMMSYGHKTGGAVQPMLPDTYRNMRRYTSRRGKRSNMGTFFSSQK